MANPQKENGYTPICNKLLEVIYSSQFNATQLKILLVVCRYTYGFSRKEHNLSEKFISKAANVSKRYISSELNKLIRQKVIKIIKHHSDTTSRVLALNKHYNEWESGTVHQQVNNSSTGEELINTTGDELFNTPGEQLFYQENNLLKQNIKQNINECFENVWKLYPEKKGKGKISDKKKKELYKLGDEVIKKCIDRYVTTKEHWKKYQHGSTFFNSGYIDYLDENYQEPTERQFAKI